MKKLLPFYPLIPLIPLLFLAGCQGHHKSGSCPVPYTHGVARLEYNNPSLVVDLDVGFKADPMPMDFDGDGDLDLLVSESGAYAEAGIFYFENISGPGNDPLFRRGERLSTERYRLGYDGMCFEVSVVNGHTHVLTPDRVNDRLLIYRDVPQNVFWDQQEMPLKARGWIENTKYNSWKMLDYDHDGRTDLVCGLNTRNGSGYLLFFRNTGSDTLPRYASPVTVLTGNKAPHTDEMVKFETALADFDGDGDYDYLATTPYARFLYYENTGTPHSSLYAPPRYLQDSSGIIQLETHYGGAVKTTVIDWNGDGRPDLLAGDEDGKVSYLENLGSVGDGPPLFTTPRFFRQEARYVDFGALTAPRVYDWDHDGRADILSGNGTGHIGFIRNLGGYPPRWDAPHLLTAGDTIIRLCPPEAHWGYTTLDAGLWDDDDLPDILVNNHHGNVVWFRNIGTLTAPRLAPPRPVHVRWQGRPRRPAWVPGHAAPGELLAPWRTSPLLYDYDGDGRNDLVMLDDEGYLALYRHIADDSTGPVVGPPERVFVYADGTPLLLNQRKGSSSGRLKITLADWDGDGTDDLIVASKPAVDWFKGEGKKDGKRVMTYMGRIVSRTLMGHTDGPVVCDWNGDGIPDLLVGTETGIFYYWQRNNINITTTMTSDHPQQPAKYKYFKR